MLRFPKKEVVGLILWPGQHQGPQRAGGNTPAAVNILKPQDGLSNGWSGLFSVVLGVCEPSDDRGARKDQHSDWDVPIGTRENILESSAEVLLLGSEAAEPQDGRAKLLLKNNY